ncbi:class I adenylate-forming enzyme family protein [Sphingomonas sp. PB2P19]|uniref:class I adenylate-forming enzyme family protein n=1 Tax=Sphingomonas rhamnosi TaxID=3096156 RepID=UPI002FCBAA6A
MPPDALMLQRSAVHRVACAVVAAEVRRIRETELPEALRYDWPDAVPIGATGLGLDSLEQLGAVGALAETFDLDDGMLGAERAQTVGDWVDWVMKAHRSRAGRICVRTSGSTGAPRLCAHSVADILDEAALWAERCADRRRVVALVPASHLYGMIWTAVLPSLLGVPVRRATVGLSMGLAAGDLVVAVPEQWEALLRLMRRFPEGVVGVSSAGPLDDRLARNLIAAGLTQLIDVYGSSETAAIGTRIVPSSDYDLLPRWTMTARGEGDWQLVDRTGTTADFPDYIERTGERSLRPVGRRDGAVQVAGHNVWPERIAQLLRDSDGVAEATVRLGATGRLKAFIVPLAGQDPTTLAIDLERAVAHLAGHERPKSFRFGSRLPRNGMGKLCDWA